MANIKISELTTISNIADDDLLAIVDKSANETKNMPLSAMEERLIYTLGLIKLQQALGIENNTWNSSDTYSIGDIVVYNTAMYKNLTGTNTSTTPDIDTINWGQVPTILNEYNTSDKNAYSCDYINDIMTYSTDEYFTGKHWTNGKPIYGKVLTVNTGSTLDLWSSIAHNISNVDFIMITNAFFVNGNSDREMLPNSDTQVAINNTNIRLVLKNASMKNRNMTLTVEYTKTTD